MKEIRLYIADKIVDLDSESVITMNYTLEDANNPTIVKNSFSKSISLPATANNNDLFGHIYNLSRKTIIDDTQHSGVYFNPLKRTPFQLFIEGELVESGYIQLTNITNTNGNPRYTIQAYGGLGDFLYSLMYDENGDKRNLASLNFGIEGHEGDHTTEMDFEITKEVVAEAWSHLPGSGRNTLAEVITFVPAYNGVNKNFDSSHALLNYNNAGSLGFPRAISANGKTYETLNGYGLLTFNRAWDETEVRDLRSYLQRPALSVRALIEACANPVNNGGYTVNLDPSFFKEDNALYYDAYITLPMLGNKIESKDSSITFKDGSDYIGDTASGYAKNISVGDLSLVGNPTNTHVVINMPLSLTVNTTQYNELFTDLTIYTKGHASFGSDSYQIYEEYQSAIIAQLIAQDARGNIIAASPEMVFTHNSHFNRAWEVYYPIDKTDRGHTRVRGHFALKDGVRQFVSEEGNNTFPLSLSFYKASLGGVTIRLRIQRAYRENYPKIATDASLLWQSGDCYIDPNSTGIDVDALKVSGTRVNCIYSDGMAELGKTNLPSVASGSKVTKDILLGGTESPAEYLLSYTKLFGLKYLKDTTSKTITITQNYYDGDIVDISRRIDRSQAMSITPNVFSKKFMRMGLKQPETYFATKYKESHKLEYGQKRVDTGYSFNVDTEELYNGNVFTSAVPCLATSKMYNSFYNLVGAEAFPPLADNATLSLAYSSDKGVTYDKYDQELPSATYVDASKTIPFSITKGYDVMPKMCYFKQNGEERESVDISNNLVMLNGNVDLKNANGEAITYWLTDDTPEMIMLNDKNCYLLTLTEFNSSQSRIALPYTRLPQFLSILLMSGNVLQSLEFAKSKETYIPNTTYPDSVTLYEKYWSVYFTDRMDVDTCKMSCMVDLSGIIVNGEIFRKFFFFDNNIWLLNKVEDYDPTKDRLTKCEFIKVKSKTAYLGNNEGYTTTIEEVETIEDVE